MLDLYGLDRCQTCRKALQWLDRALIPYNFVDYREHPVAASMLKLWAAHLGGFEAMINRSSTTWRQLPDARRVIGTDAEWIVLLRSHPALVRRPVAVVQDGTVLQGFSPTLYAQHFSNAAH